MNKHYFIALPLPNEVKVFLSEGTTLLKKQYKFQKWVHMDDLHLTLAFLGASNEAMLRKCWKDCEFALREFPFFSLQLNEFGVFGRRDQPRIFWSAPSAEEKLMSLQGIVANACAKNGFVLDDRPFSPHITLARRYKGDAPFSEEDLLKCQSMLAGVTPFQVKEVALFETRMDQEPKYVVKESLYLKEGL